MHLVILLYAFFASVFTVSKTGLQYTQPLFFVGTRMFIAGGLMLAYQQIFRRGKLTFKKRHLWSVFQLAVFNIYLTNIFEFWGLQYLPSFKTCFIYSLSPFFAALLSYLMFSEKMSFKKWIGLLIGFIGMGPILLNETFAEERVAHLFFLSWAEIAVMLASICSVYGWIILRQMVNEEGFTPLLANGLSMLLGGCFALFHSYWVEDWSPLPVTQTVPFFECMLLLIIISNMICYNLYGHLLRKFTATFMSFAGFTTPLFTAFFGWLFLSEEVTLPFFLSTGIVFLGLLIYYQEELKQGYSVPAQAI